MSDEGIRVPTWALPAFLAVLSGAVVWGASEARAQATQEEVDRIEAVVEKQLLRHKLRENSQQSMRQKSRLSWTA